MTSRDKKTQWEPITFRKIAMPLGVFSAFWILSIIGYVATGEIGLLLNFGYLGTAIGVGLGLFALLPKKQKPVGRRVSLLLMGLYLFGLVGVASKQNIQIEGVWFSLYVGVAQAAVMHYLVAKVFGPLLFGRLWCGWACWTVMVLDMLPWKRPQGRIEGWGWGRYAHFGLSLGGSLALAILLGFSPAVNTWTAVWWFVGGNALYYAVGIGLAWALKDNRAFCKYLCPVSVPLKVFSRFSLIKVQGDASQCNECDACVKTCPMDVDIPQYILNDQRVLSSECTLCQTCVSTCAKGALKLSVGFDAGFEEHLRYVDDPLRVPVLVE